MIRIVLRVKIDHLDPLFGLGSLIFLVAQFVNDVVGHLRHVRGLKLNLLVYADVHEAGLYHQDDHGECEAGPDEALDKKPFHAVAIISVEV